MAFEIEVSDEFRDWYEPLTESEQLSIEHVITQLAEAGPMLRFPQSSGIRSARVSHMRELRVQHEGRPYRILYAFDPQRAAYLLLGGEKTGDDRWYEVMVPKAEAIYAGHLEELKNRREQPK